MYGSVLDNFMFDQLDPEFYYKELETEVATMSSGSIVPAERHGNPLNPTFQGYIGSTMDALILFEACLAGQLTHVPRRPHDRERGDLIVSGNVFIYEEHSSGIKRWTDGVPWSPSRILGNFLLYRELDKPFQPGEKKRAMKRNKPEGGVSKPQGSSRANSISSFPTGMMTDENSMANFSNSTNPHNDAERALVGSLIDSYQFKQDGLIKKTISVTHRGVQHHLVSYYSLADVMARKLITPSEAPHLSNITPRASLISSGNFRAPVDDNELSMHDQHLRGYTSIPSQFGDYSLGGTPGSRSMSMSNMYNYTNYTPTWPGSGQYLHPNPYQVNHSLPQPLTYAPAGTSYAQPPYGLPANATQHAPADFNTPLPDQF
ncbi:Global transcription regulator sge1 [Parahypoxylon ruwenzoriense]